jgi:hypothetical protein
VGAQVGRRALQLVQPVGSQQLLEERDHRPRREAGAVQQLQAHPVRLALVLARVVELVLDLQRARARHGRFGDLAALVPAARREDRQRERRERGELHAALAVEHARLVVLQDVPDLVGEHARELRFVVGEQEQGAVHADVAAGKREGVDGVVAHHEEIDRRVWAVRGGEQPRAHRVDVIRDLGVVDVIGVRPHVAHDAVADGLLLLRRQRGGGDVAEIRQALREGEGRVGEQEGGDEGAEFHSVGRPRGTPGIECLACAGTEPGCYGQQPQL